MEVGEIREILVDSFTLKLHFLIDCAISELLILWGNPYLSSSIKEKVDNIVLGLRFINLYTQWFEALEEKKKGILLGSEILDIIGGATKSLHSSRIKGLQTQDLQDWESLTPWKLKVSKDLWRYSSSYEDPSRYKFSSFELQKRFHGCLLDFLHDLLKLKANNISDQNVEIQSIKERAQLLMQISEFMQIMDNNNTGVKDFKILLQTWLYNIAYLSLFYFIFNETEKIGEPLEKWILSAPVMITRLLLGLKCLWSTSQNRLLMDIGVLNFADFFLEVMQLNPFKDDIQALHSGLIFLTTFLMDPPLANDAESISKEVDSLICLSSLEELKEDAAKKSDDLHYPCLEKMNRAIEHVRKLYISTFQYPASFNFPSTNLLGVLDSLLEDLKGTSEHCGEHVVVIVHKELVSLRPFIKTILVLQRQNLEVKDLWTRSVNVVYRAKIGIQLLLFANSFVLDDVKYFSDIIDETKLLKIDINKIQVQESSNTRVPDAQDYISLVQANKSKIDEEPVGFEDDAETIIHQLIGDSKTLKIISIFGMAGQGKTTLAKKIYNDPSVQKRFHKHAWCCPSQAYQTRKLFLEILSDIMPNSDFSGKKDEELEHLIRQRLLGHRYLVVIDDIWDLGPWNALKSSLPDQNNGSRIIFTSRIENVALEAKQGCFLYHLGPLSFDESLELLKRKLFGKEEFSPELVDVSRQIAKACNGLPLAIVVVGGILLEKPDDLNRWNHIAESINSLANDGCEDILELSYKNLPEFLKPCFLYFGAFREDEVIRVKRLIQLWISEGFIQKSEVKTLENVAKEYLMDLIARSLVIVARRSSNGEIKACRIHDLLNTFCLEKGKKEKFLHVESLAKGSHDSTVSKNYRICFLNGGCGFNIHTNSSVHSLLFIRDYGRNLVLVDLFYICNFKLLQVLDMENWVPYEGPFREEVVLLVHLRYLAIVYNHSEYLTVPPAIANLRKLETFRLGCSRACLPSSVWTMTKLRHISIGEFKVDGNGCEPQESSTLENIQTFSTAIVFIEKAAAEKLLRRILNVHKLKCTFFDSDKKFNLFSGFEFLSQLESLNVQYYGGMFRSCAFRFPSTLKKLTITNFRLLWSEVSTISNLPQLEVLKLKLARFEGNVWNLQDGEFPKLKCLKLTLMEIQEWNILGDYPFPCLEELFIGCCPHLKEVPYLFAESIGTLERIEVSMVNPSVVCSVRQIEEDFEHVKVIIIDDPFGY